MCRTQRLFFVIFLALFLPVSAHAFELTVAPVVIDEKAKARDIVRSTITLVNNTNRKLSLYPTVKNIDVLEGEKDFEQAINAEDRADSLANWIELSRGVIDLSPGEERLLPIVIRVNLNAVPNIYHAQISFAEGSNRAEAEEKEALSVVTINFEVLADIKEEMQLLRFFTDSILFSGDDVLFKYQLENIGNQSVKPKGDIRIYDRRGAEVATLEANKEGKSFSPDELNQLASVWGGAEGFGRYKAFLSIDYGDNQKASIQDTVYFWILPLKTLIALFTGGLVLIVIAAVLYHRRLERKHLALAGTPLTAHMDEPHHPSLMETIADEVQEEVGKQKKRGWWPRRKKKVEHASPAMPCAPETPKAALAKAAPPLREAMPHTPHAAYGGGRTPASPSNATIDLKRLKGRSVGVHDEPGHEAHHVINLKKRN